MSTSPPPARQTELEVRELEPRLTACVRLRIAPDELAAAFPAHLPRIAETVREHGGTIAGPPYARYYHWGWDDVDVEIGAPISALIPSLPEAAMAERGEVACGELPGGRAAVVVHIGPYERLGEGWRQLEELMAASQLASAGCGWEHYVDDPETVPAAELHTELVHPVA